MSSRWITKSVSLPANIYHPQRTSSGRYRLGPESNNELRFPSTGIKRIMMLRNLRPSRSPASRKDEGRKSRARHPERREIDRQRSAAYRSKNLEICRARCRNSHYKRKYGITLEEWNMLFSAQGFQCAACPATEPTGVPGSSHRGRWHTDHDHATGKLRGILCHRCNVAIGYLEDAILMPRLMAYLELKK